MFLERFEICLQMRQRRWDIWNGMLLVVIAVAVDQRCCCKIRAKGKQIKRGWERLAVDK